jgi:pyruvate-formate lyase-activating enzyme
MDFANRPIKEFYCHCLAGAKNKGFKWVISLLARDAECHGLYRNLRRTWLSLDSITGEQFLFIIAGKENQTHDDRWNSRIIDTFEHVGIYSDYAYFINTDAGLTDYVRYNWREDRERYMKKIPENQTEAVNSLRDYFGIAERDIPCLIFTSLYHNKTHIVPIQKGANDIYGYFKNMFNLIEPRLRIIRELEVRQTELLQKQKNHSSAIKSITFSGDEVIFALYEELYQLAIETGNSELLDCITNKIYNKFSQPLRSRVNKYVDLVKNYEKNQNHTFDPSAITDVYYEKIKTKLALERGLSEINDEADNVDSQHRHYLAEIEDIIMSSEMNEKTMENSQVLVTVTGGNPQINVAFDEATIQATQNNSIDWDKLCKLLSDVRSAITADMPPDDAEAVSESLEVIEAEAKQEKPRKSFLKTALTGLRAIRGTAEFGAAVATLVQYVETFL